MAGLSLHRLRLGLQRPVATAASAPLEISGTPVLTATEGQAYAGFTVSASGGTPPYAYSLVGTWPSGISINSSTGAVSGTPTESGSFTGLSVRVTDDASDTDDLPTFTLDVQSVTYVAPTFVATGSAAEGVAGITPGLPSGWAENDILLVFFYCRAGDTATAPSGYTEGDSSPQSVGTAGSSASAVQHWFWKRATASESAPSFADAGAINYAVMAAIRGCPTSGSPFDVVAGDTTAGGTTSVSMPAVTTTIGNTLIVQSDARSGDFATAQFSGWANANLSSLTEQFDAGTTVSSGGGLGIVSGVAASAGNIGNTTATMGSTFHQAKITIALKGLPA